jgi:glycosyltransferase involved in cell wall biosynthesis
MLRERGLKRKLVLVGKKGWKFEGIFETMGRLGLEPHVVHLDYLPFGDLPAVYSGAALMAYPSLYEGFGLPPLEAMACGTPVVTSDISSLPEVVGDAALMVKPTDVDALAGAMEKILKDDNLRHRLSEDGLKRAGTFTWEKTAKLTSQVYRKVGGADR